MKGSDVEVEVSRMQCAMGDGLWYCWCNEWIFQRCNRPTKNETTNVMAYNYSGQHHESYEINCQAV